MRLSVKPSLAALAALLAGATLAAPAALDAGPAVVDRVAEAAGRLALANTSEIALCLPSAREAAWRDEKYLWTPISTGRVAGKNALAVLKRVWDNPDKGLHEGMRCWAAEGRDIFLMSLAAVTASATVGEREAAPLAYQLMRDGCAATDKLRAIASKAPAEKFFAPLLAIKGGKPNGDQTCWAAADDQRRIAAVVAAVPWAAKSVPDGSLAAVLGEASMRSLAH